MTIGSVIHRKGGSTVTVWANQEWQPIPQDSPWHAVLLRLGINYASLQGTWEIRGADPNEDPDLYWAVIDPAQVEELRQTLNQSHQAVTLGLGDGLEIRYLPPVKRQGRASIWRKLWTVALGIILKFKLVLVFLSVVVSLVVYGLAFGWAFGAGLIIVIAIHEFGHVAANRIKGIPSSLPIFVPLVGAFVQMKRSPQNAADEAFVGVMGPVFGLAATLLAFVLGLWSGIPWFFAVTEIGFLLHVFNLMPVLPLDGGRTVGFWRWKAWIPGIIGVLVVLFYNPLTNQFTFDPVTVIIVAIIFVSMVREPRMHARSYTDIPSRARWLYTSLWGFLLALSIVGYWGVGHLRPL